MSLREIGLQRGRALLLVGAVATGVALIVACDVINSSVLASFARTFQTVAGPADLTITLGHGEVAFDQSVAERVRRDPAVVAAVPLVRGTVALADDPADALQLFGAELTAEEDLARYGVHLATARRAALDLMEDPNGILLADVVGRRLGAGVGSRLRLTTANGIGDFTVRGLLAPEGLASALAGQLVVMDLAAAQLHLAKDGAIDQLDVTLAPDADAEVVRARLAGALPSGFSVAPPAARSARYGDILRGLRYTLGGMSVMCMVAGLFVIFNGMSASVVHRMPAFATLRVLGANAATLVRLLLVETLILAAIGAAAGLAIGVALARVLLGLVGDTFGTMVQMRFIVPEVDVEGRTLVLGALGGIVTAMAAAWFPARDALRRDPLTMGTTTNDRPPRTTLVSALFVTATLIAISTVVIAARAHHPPLITAGSILWYLAMGLVGVPFVAALSALVERWLPRAYGAAGRVAAASIGRVPTRAGMTVTAIAYVFAIAVTLAVVIESYVVAAREYVSALHDGDLVVSAVATEGGWLETPVSESVPAEIAAVEGVARVESARVVPGQHFRTGRIGILALEPSALARFGGPLWRAGDLAEARAALAAGDAVAVSTVFAEIHDVAVGDRLTLEAPSGTFTMPVVGLFADMSSSSGTIVMSRPAYRQRWHDTTVNRINVFLAPDVTGEEVRRRIVAAVGHRHRLKIDGLREALTYIDGEIRDAFAFSRSLQLLIIIVAIAGIFDLLFARIFERRRELATWRVMGASDRAVRRSVIAESLALGALATVVGFPLGLVTAWLWVRHIIPSLVGYDIALLVPPLPTIAAVALVLAATVAAGHAAAVRATQASILQSLRGD